MYDIASSKHSELGIRTLRFMHTHMMIIPAFNYMLRCMCAWYTVYTFIVAGTGIIFTNSMFIRGFHLHSAMSCLSILCTSSHDGITINIVIAEYVWNVQMILEELEFVGVVLTLCTLAQRKLR